MMNATYRLRLAGILALLASGCATVTGPHIWSEADPEATFDGLKAYAWDPSHMEPTGDGRVDDEKLEARVLRFADEVLAERGFEKVAEEPDFLLGYSAQVKTTVAHGITPQTGVAPGQGGSLVGSNIGYRRYASGWSPSAASVHRYHEGTILLDVIHPGTGELMWRGAARDEVIMTQGPDDERLRNVLGSILDEFPSQ